MVFDGDNIKKEFTIRRPICTGTYLFLGQKPVLRIRVDPDSNRQTGSGSVFGIRIRIRNPIPASEIEL